MALIKEKEENNKQSNIPKRTIGHSPKQQLKDTVNKIYTDEEIREFKMDDSIGDHPLYPRPIGVRSKLAYKELLNNLKPTTKYLLPGQVVMFEYMEPKTKEDLEFYDRTPLTLFFGIMRTKDGNIREIGINLHYYPPFTRARILSNVYRMWKQYFADNFNQDQHKVNPAISWQSLKRLMRRDAKIAFGVKMYIPSLRANSYVIPTRLLPTAFFTEGNFSKATRAQVHAFWRKFSRF